VVLEVWDQYVRDDGNAELVAAKANGGVDDVKRRRSSTSKPNDLFGKRDRTGGERDREEVFSGGTCSLLSLRPLEARLGTSWLQLTLLLQPRF